MIKPRIKICCISSPDEANLAIEAGAAALGLVGKMPSGPGVIDDRLIREIAMQVPPPIATFLLTSEISARNIINHHKKVNTTTLQLVDAISRDDYLLIRQALPAIKIVQVIHVKDYNSVNEAIILSDFVDAILLDSGNPDTKIKILGGTGKIHDWKLSRQIVESASVPVFLAGGLTPENVQRAMDEVSPFGLDVCNGVRTNDKLDREKLESFLKATGY